MKCRRLLSFVMLTILGFATDVPAQAAPAAQTRAPSLLRAAPRAVPVGVFQASSGSWLQTGTPMPGADVIFNNTRSPNGFFLPTDPGATFIGQGYLPCPDQPYSPSTQSGCATQYTVSGFEFGYCTDQPSIDFELDFYHQRLPCNSQAVPFLTIPLSGFPGSTSGTFECFTVVIDLRGGFGALAPFTMFACGDGQWQGPTISNEMFAFGVRILNVVGTNTGPLTGGDWGSSTLAAGTRWSRASVDYSVPGNGIGLSGYVDYEPGLACADLYPYSMGLYLRLFADACGTLVGEPYCTGDNSATPCPCGNTSPALNLEGCRNSVNGVNGARLEVVGTASLAADSVLLRALRLPATTSALYFQGTQRVNSGAGALFGDGLRCAGGTVTRLASRTAAEGQVEFPLPGEPAVSASGGITAPGSRTYQVWYRNSVNYCTASSFNLTNGWELVWGL